MHCAFLIVCVYIYMYMYWVEEISDINFISIYL